jgi:hypothetical protein
VTESSQIKSGASAPKPAEAEPAVTADEQGPEPLYGGDSLADADEDAFDGEDRIDDDEAHCVRCGCSARRPCAGGCYWVVNHQMADLCSRCANPAELAIAARGLE